MSAHQFLTDDERLLRDAARDFAQSEVAPRARELDEAEEFPWDIVKQMGPLGWMGVLVPEQYGGAGGTAMQYALAIEEFSRASAGVALIMAAHNSLGNWALMTFGTEEQRQKYLPPLGRGEYLGAYSLTEPNSGSDAGSLRTRAVRDGNSYVLNGRKAFCTSADVAGVSIVFASTDPEQRSRGISAFLVERGTPGFSTGVPLKKMGMRCSTTVEIILEDCRVPVENRLGEEGQGFKIAMQVLDVGRIGIAAQALGIAQAALDAATDYARNREQFGHFIGEFEGVRWPIADMATDIEASRLLIYQAARLKDNEQPYGLAASMAKLHASHTAVKAADRAVQIHGGYGYVRDMGVERLYREAKATELYEGTSEVQRLVISRALLPGLKGAY